LGIICVSTIDSSSNYYLFYPPHIYPFNEYRYYLITYTSIVVSLEQKYLPEFVTAIWNLLLTTDSNVKHDLVSVHFDKIFQGDSIMFQSGDVNCIF